MICYYLDNTSRNSFVRKFNSTTGYKCPEAKALRWVYSTANVPESWRRPSLETSSSLLTLTTYAFVYIILLYSWLYTTKKARACSHWSDINISLEKFWHVIWMHVHFMEPRAKGILFYWNTVWVVAVLFWHC